MFTQIAQQQMPETILTSEFIKLLNLLAVTLSSFIVYSLETFILYIYIYISLYLFKGSYNNSINNILK